MKILLIGNGAREHVIGETLVKSTYHPELFIWGSAKNPGLVNISSDYQIGRLADFESLSEFVRAVQPDFAIVGPDDPIARGVADFLAERKLGCVAPFKKVAQLESSKSFTRELLRKYNISGNPLFRNFYTEEGIESFLQELKNEFVIKADGLKGGKGVKVSGDHINDLVEGVAYARECIKEAGKVVIEEKLEGQEFSLMSFVDGKDVKDMPPVQDHKRAFEGDKGPNTGGMGSYSCADHLLPFLTPEDVHCAHMINVAVNKALFNEIGQPYKGVMYGGFMKTRQGIRLIEYNARFGDPECINILPLLRTDLIEICLAILESSLSTLKIEFSNQATVCKYVVPEGYPDHPVSGEKVEIGTMPAYARVYFAGVDQKEDGIYMTSSRALAVLGIGATLEEAERKAEEGASSIKGRVFHRRDIGTRSFIQQKVEMLN